MSTEEAVEQITRMMLSGGPHYFATANVDFLVQAQQDPELHRILLDADLVVCDGNPVLWASRLLGDPLRERVAGADLVPLLLRVAAHHGLRVFVLGAVEESAAGAVERLRRDYPGLIVAGHYSPPFALLLDMDHETITERVREARPDLLLVAFGCPKQEKWISMYSRALGVPVSAGIGASIDFLSGHMRRAPLWMQRFGLEWAFRLLQEPRRLAARYAKDFRVFGRQLLAQYFLLGRHANRAEASASDPVVAVSDGVLCIAWPARLDAAAVLRSRMPDAALTAPSRDCVLDLAGVEIIDSTGLGYLIGLRRDIRLRGGELVLQAPSAAVVSALRQAHLTEVFPTAPDFAGACRLLEEGRGERTEPVRGVAPNGSVSWRGELKAEDLASVWTMTLSHAEEHARAGGTLSIDLSDLRFVDSAGLLLMKRAKTGALQELGTPVIFQNPTPAVRRIARLAGVEHSLFDPGDPSIADARSV